MENLKAWISECGPIPFVEYMERCLFDPEMGYYSHLKNIGAKGDFVTSPECGPYLGNVLAHYCAKHTNPNETFSVVELGAGTGRLAFDFLTATKALKKLPDTYWIVEKSPALRMVQAETLAGLEEAIFKRISWCDVLPVASIEGFLIANEVLDALPVERFVKTERGAKRLGVGLLQDPSLQNKLGSIELDEILILPAFMQPILNRMEVGYCSEICLSLSGFLNPILKAFKQGRALVIDYGYPRERYYEAGRRDGTLVAYHRHQLISPFEAPGECDITAHVDFTAVAEIFLAENWEIEGLIPQGQFLIEEGVLDRYPLVQHHPLRRLIDPRLMGEVFQVLIATKNNARSE